MGIIRNFVKQGLDLGQRFRLKQPQAFDAQTAVLRKLIEKAQDTSFGREHGFRDLYYSPNISEEFASRVPLGNYSTMHPWWQRAYNGESNVCWPGQTTHFALSSGTSEGASKYIPVTKDMLKQIKRTSAKQLLAIARSDLPKEFMTKHSLMVSGSTDLQFNGITYSGDLSGITTGNLPFWFEPFSKPDKKIRKNRDWETKIEEMVSEAKKWDVGMIAGVPAWIQILFEKIIERYNLNTIHDIWPNFKVYIHGGVAFAPYKKAFEKLVGEEIFYYETYLASEGFMAFATRPNAEGMALQVNSGTYFEFVPFDRFNFSEDGDLLPEAKALNIMQIEPGVEYALVISTVSGTWRYLIGDVVKFVDSQNLELVITGRIKHFLSLCGEHLSVDNMTKAVHLLSEEYGTSMPEFTVMGIPHEGLFAHHWYIGCDQDLDPSDVKVKLDHYLKELNDDYAVERNHALHEILVDVVPHQVFIDFMKEKGKMGAQNKFPRVLKGDTMLEWQAFMAQRQKNTVAL
ncbi:MAG: GH3 auxin-responsive promoter family protein [Bacteroidota bacterium]|nr:GH3 auxin-responsive promoter family protein [Bacteroidota bacterium]MDX5429593.1 GH3 auxin-responsive promoter family protein [Bacteroidota bacterium]MDX5468377.1 GH3 auxin-responsive promoter family protein [Bacteroidota bacterium]